jgi:RNA polymerase sigma factor (sigma-70 family)
MDQSVNEPAASPLRTPPTPEDEAFENLMRRVREGAAEATFELVRRYENDVRRTVRRLLDPRLRSKVDSMDFVQLAWKSFFRVPRHADRLNTPQDFIAYLVKMACNKVRMEHRRSRTLKRNVRREVPLGKECEQAIAPDPEPMDAAIALERLQQLRKDLSPRHRQILDLRLEGNTFVEIGKKLKIDPKTADRFIKRLERETPP